MTIKKRKKATTYLEYSGYAVGVANKQSISKSLLPRPPRCLAYNEHSTPLWQIVTIYETSRLSNDSTANITHRIPVEVEQQQCQKICLNNSDELITDIVLWRQFTLPTLIPTATDCLLGHHRWPRFDTSCFECTAADYWVILVDRLHCFQIIYVIITTVTVEHSRQ